MTVKYAFALIGAVAAGIAASAGPAQAQNIFSQFGSADGATALQYPVTVPNNAQPEANIHAITGFDRTFGFGSSSTNTRRADGNINAPSSPGGVFTEVNSNGHAIYIELFSPAIGATNGRGSTFPPATNLADGGSNSTTALTGSPTGCTLNTAPAGQPPNGTCTQQPQVVEFQKVFGTYRPGDIAVQWSGINDINVSGINTQAVANAIVATNVANQTEMVRQNIALGARNYVFIGLADLGTFANFTTLKPTNVPALVSQAALQTNAGMLPNLVALHQSTGANIHYFDSALFVNQIRANPTAYGFTAAGTAPNAYGIGTFGSAAAFNAQPFNVQNQFFTPDGLHWTYRYHEWLAAAIANQLLAPFTLAGQADLVDQTGLAFSNSTIRHLDTYRSREMISDLVSADMPVKAKPRPVTPGTYGALSVYVDGLYATGDTPDRAGGAGIGYNVGGATIGLDYRWTPYFLVGAAFNYSNARGTLNQGWGSMTTDAYQFAGYGSWSNRNWFADLAISGGFDNLKVTRPGLITPLTGSPDATSFVLQGKTGYLFDVAALSSGAFNASTVKLGPIVGFTYSHTHINAYTETGDPILNQSVGSQDMDGVTGRAGIELRSSYLWNRWILSPWLDLTAEHDFNGGARTLTTAQTYALALTIATPVSSLNETYGRVAGGFNVQVAQNVSVNLTGETTFARSTNNSSLTGGVRVTW
jgi:outer membrane lipase/esterase